MNKITPELLVEDMGKTVEFYTKVLGFTVTVSFPQDNPIFAILKNGNIEIMLYERKAFGEEISEFKTKPIGGSVALYIEIDDVESLYTDIQDKVRIIQELHETTYNSREFSCYDCNGYVLMFAQNL